MELVYLTSSLWSKAYAIRQKKCKNKRFWRNFLTAARRLYAAEGYQLTTSAPLQAFGTPLTEETWDLDLAHPIG